MRAYELYFESREALRRAFEIVSDADEVEACVAEPERRRLAFLVPQRSARALLDRLDGLGHPVASERIGVASGDPLERGLPGSR